jgi:hypothetical protein
VNSSKTLKFAIPGTADAIRFGCTCDPSQITTDNDGRGHLWTVAPDCPIHQPDPERVARSRDQIASGDYYDINDIIANRKTGAPLLTKAQKAALEATK